MSWRLLDLYCGSGGAARGYEMAGFPDIVGVDEREQPDYPYTFVCGDAIEYLLAHGGEFDAIHASPPCQFASILTERKFRKRHSNWIPATRAALRIIKRPWVIENVAGARNHLCNPIMLCGTMFGMRVWRHRFFEIEPRIAPPMEGYDHSVIPVVVSGTPRRNGIRKEPPVKECRDAMEIPWMTKVGLDEAIPPRFTEWIGRQLIAKVLESSTTLAQQTQDRKPE